MTGYDDESLAGESRMASAQILGYAYQLAEARREEPLDDIISRLVHADIDGQKLTPGTVRFLRHHVGCRGQRNDAKRNDTRHDGISRASGSVGTVQARASAHRRGRDHPLGFATDVDATNSSGGHTDCRHCDCEGGAARRTALRLGELRRNRLREPRLFDITRDPNPHLAFGGTGPHYCVGATWPEWRSI